MLLDFGWKPPCTVRSFRVLTLAAPIFSRGQLLFQLGIWWPVGHMYWYLGSHCYHGFSAPKVQSVALVDLLASSLWLPLECGMCVAYHLFSRNGNKLTLRQLKRKTKFSSETLSSNRIFIKIVGKTYWLHRPSMSVWMYCEFMQRFMQWMTQCGGVIEWLRPRWTALHITMP